MSDVSVGDLIAEARRLSSLIDNGVKALTEAAKQGAEAEYAYRLARAKAWAQTDGTAKQREDDVNAITAAERRVRDLAEAGRMSAIEALRSRRQQLSAVQSIAAAFRSEAEHTRYGPEVAA